VVTMRKLLLFVIVLLPFDAIAQVSDPYYEKGVELFNKKNFKGALDYLFERGDLKPQ
jgi:hypothetical protein